MHSSWRRPAKQTNTEYGLFKYGKPFHEKRNGGKRKAKLIPPLFKSARVWSEAFDVMNTKK